MRIAADVALAIHRSGVLMTMHEALLVLNAIAPHYNGSTRTPEVLLAACRTLYAGFDDYRPATKAELELEAAHVLDAAEAASDKQTTPRALHDTTQHGQMFGSWLRDAFGLDLNQLESLNLDTYLTALRLTKRLMARARQGRLDLNAHRRLTELSVDLTALFCAGCGGDISSMPGASACSPQCSREARFAHC